MTKDKSIFIKNIYYMLSYAFTVLRQGGYEEIATEKFENVHDLFAAILAKGIGRQLKQGLYREYRNCKEGTPVLHGKSTYPARSATASLKRRFLLVSTMNFQKTTF